MNTITISPEREEDFSRIDNLLRSVYKGEAEVKFIREIREIVEYIPQLALTAYIESILVGYVLLPRVSLRTANEVISLLTIYPFAINKEYQIEKILLVDSLKRAEREGYGAVVTFYNGNFFRRNGFLPAQDEYGLEVDIEINKDDFLAIELKEGFLYRKSGFVLFSSVFDLVL